MFILYQILIILPMISSAERLMITDFEGSGLQQWKTKSFKGQTRYEIVIEDQRKVILAQSEKAASGLIREIKVDISKTPFLNWTWKLNEIIEGNNERKKDGDDFAARIYVIASTGFGLWNTAAINYVWSNASKPGEYWPNPFTKKAMMFSVDMGKLNLGTWRTYKQNVKDDFKKLFGKDLKEIEAVAIMSDTDNSQKKAKALYGDIYFTSD